MLNRGENGLTVTEQTQIKFKENPKIKALIPRPTTEDYETLKNSLKHGQKEPITVTSDGTILDGYTRYKALKELGVPDDKILYQIQPKIDVSWFPDVKDYVYAINNRRNLNLYQRASLALEETSATLQ